jgi:hypothetical protein
VVQISPEDWPLLSGLLDEALDIPAERRDTWLESLPAPQARFKETLREMLRIHAEAEGDDFLNEL